MKFASRRCLDYFEISVISEIARHFYKGNSLINTAITENQWKNFVSSKKNLLKSPKISMSLLFFLQISPKICT